MGQPKGGYTKSVGKAEGTQVALPKREVRHIAIMPSTSCGELKALFFAGLITNKTTMQCYEDTSRPNSQASFDDMQDAVVKVLRTNGWSYARINKNVRFYDADITSNCVEDAAEWGKELDWVYLDFCGVVDFDALMVLHDDWKANRFSRDAEISVTSNHKLRAASKRLKPIMTAMAKYANRAAAYARPTKPVTMDMEAIIVGTQVGIAYALPFGATVVESRTYARGMTTTRFARTRTAKRPQGVKGVFNGTAVKIRPKAYRHLSGAQWAWSWANPDGCRYA